MLHNRNRGVATSLNSSDLRQIEQSMQELATRSSTRRRFLSQAKNFIFQLWGSTIVSFKYVSKETRNRWNNFLIGLFTIFIVVLFISVLQNTIQKSPFIFLRLAEDNVGEMDILMVPQISNMTRSPVLNGTDISTRLEGNPLVNGTTPRWILYGTLANAQNTNKNVSAVLLILDTDKEEQLRIGRAWTHRTLGEGEIHIRDALIRALGVRAQRGDRVLVSPDLSSLSKLAGADFGSETSSNGTMTPEMLQAILVRLGLIPEGNSTISIPTEPLFRALGIPITPLTPATINITTDQLFSSLEQAGVFNTGGLGMFSLEYTVVDSITKPGGKYPSALGNVAIIDSKHLMAGIKDAFFRNAGLVLLTNILGIQQQIVTAIDNFRIDDYALSVVVKFSNRVETYTKNSKGIDADFITFTDSIIASLGLDYQVTMTFPVVEGLTASSYIRLFLDQIFNGVIVMLSILGVLLIYALLLSNVEEKTYEYGMMRALGMKNVSLLQVITLQALIFAIPAIIIGLVAAFGLNVIIEQIIASFVLLTPVYTMATIAVVFPAAVGLIIPLIANIIPIRRALSKTLRDSLDLYHQTFNETTVRMIKLAQLGLKPWQTSLSILLIVIGFVVYYLVPYAFTFNNFPLFFTILNLILLGMLLGLCVIAVILQPVVENIILNIILWGPERRMKILIKKNLTAHRRRSRKTFLMVTIAIAFIIFAGVVFSLQAKSLGQTIEVFVGGDVVAQCLDAKSFVMPEDKLRAYLDQLKAQDVVDGYTFVTFPLTGLPHVSKSRFASLAYYPSAATNIYGVEENFLDVAYSKYFLIDEYDEQFTYASTPSGKPDIVRSLYVDAGKASLPGEKSGYVPPIIYTGSPLGSNSNSSNYDSSQKYLSYLDVIISEAARDSLSVDVNSPLQIRVRAYNQDTNTGYTDNYIGMPRAMVHKMPAFFFSSYRFTVGGSPLIVSMDTYRNLSKNAAEHVDYKLKDPEDVPKQKLIVSLVSGISKEQRQDVVNGIRSFMDPDNTILTDVADSIESTKMATDTLLLFFNIVAIIAVILCFFILWLSTTANVKENSWEFGVLRSVGLSVTKLIRAYVYESLCLVLAAFLSGTIVGIAIAMTLTLQFNLFLELPFQFDFPWVLFFSVFALSIFVAILGSAIPAMSMRKKEIALVLRGL